MSASAHTAYAWDPRFLEHDTRSRGMTLPDGSTLDPVEHYSNNAITRRTAQLIAGSGIMDHLIPVAARPATLDEVCVYHTPEYVADVRRITESGGGMLDDQTRVTEGSYDAALLAAGAGMELVDAVIDRHARNGYGLLRPPGHHAMAGQGMGFCVFNNLVIAARHAQRRGLGRVAIVDWDVHHGNGTQAAFWNDPSVLFISLHQDNWYPGGWGNVEDTGGVGAKGTTVNVPLPPGTGSRGYLLAIERVVLPAIRAFRPEMIFISAGQDASMVDVLGRMLVTMAGYREMAAQLQALADELCEGRLIGLQEGGYSVSYVPFCTLGVIEGITGVTTGIVDGWIGSSEYAQAEREFRPQQAEAIEAAARMAGLT